MTSTQWLFEYFSLKEKERDEFELVESTFKAFRRMLVGLLGLDLLKNKDEIEENKESFIPMSLLAGRREVVETILKQWKDEETTEYIEDEEFEKMSQAIARGDDLGDMSPIIDPSGEEADALKQWFTPGRMEELKRMGVKITHHDEPDTTPVPTSGKIGTEFNTPLKNTGVKIEFED